MSKKCFLHLTKNDINLGKIRVQLIEEREVPLGSLQPRCVYHEDPWMRLGNKIFGEVVGYMRH